MTIQWNKTQNTWHTDVENVGRYSVRRVAKYQKFGAYLNNVAITSVPASSKVEDVKRDVEERINTAEAIANVDFDEASTLKLGNTSKTISTRKMWLASWATPEDADAENDDRQTAHTLATPMGVILLQADGAAHMKVQAMALAEWIDACEGDEVEQDRYRKAKWQAMASPSTERVYHLHTFSNELLGVVHIRPATVIGE